HPVEEPDAKRVGEGRRKREAARRVLLHNKEKPGHETSTERIRRKNAKPIHRARAAHREAAVRQRELLPRDRSRGPLIWGVEKSSEERDHPLHVLLRPEELFELAGVEESGRLSPLLKRVD